MKDYKSRSSTLYLRERRRSLPAGIIIVIALLVSIAGGIGAWLLWDREPSTAAESPVASTSAADRPVSQAKIIPLRLPALGTPSPAGQASSATPPPTTGTGE